MCNFSAILDLLAPRHCGGCGTISSVICGRCLDVLLAMPVPSRTVVDGVGIMAAFPFDGPVRRLAHRGKYRDGRTLLRFLAMVAAPRVRPYGSDLIVAVPLGRRRRRERGYNQAELIAGVWGKTWNLPLGAGLVRVRDTAPQVGVDAEGRVGNVRGAFAWIGTPVLGGRRIVVVDDVVTTGATVAAAAAALRGAGAAEVRVAAVARRL